MFTFTVYNTVLIIQDCGPVSFKNDGCRLDIISRSQSHCIISSASRNLQRSKRNKNNNTGYSLRGTCQLTSLQVKVITQPLSLQCCIDIYSTLTFMQAIVLNSTSICLAISKLEDHIRYIVLYQSLIICQSWSILKLRISDWNTHKILFVFVSTP